MKNPQQLPTAYFGMFVHDGWTSHLTRYWLYCQICFQPWWLFTYIAVVCHGNVQYASYIFTVCWDTDVVTVTDFTLLSVLCYVYMIWKVCFPSVLWHCWLRDRKGIRPVKTNVLVCWWWWFDLNSARLIIPVVTTTSIIPSSNTIKNGEILVPANPASPAKWPLKWEREIWKEYLG